MPPTKRGQRRPPVAVRRGQPTADPTTHGAVEGDGKLELPEGAVLPARGPNRKIVDAFSIGPVRPVDDEKRHINAMFYGPYGHGKTTLVTSADDVPEMRDVLFVSAESGTMSITSRRTLDVVEINKYNQIARIYDYLILHCKWRDEDPPNIEKMLEYERALKSQVVPVKDQTGEPDPNRTWFEEQRLRSGKPMDEPYMYQTVIVDSLSEVHKYLVYKFTGVVIGETKLDEEIEKMEEWPVAQEMFRLFIRSFRDLPMHSLFVCAEAIEPAERNKKRNPHAGQALPKLAGQAAGDVVGFTDIVGYLNREITGGETNRYLYLGAGYEGWISKHRFENLPDLEYVDNPTLASLIELSRKDAEYGSSQPSAGALSSTVPSSGNPASPVPPNRRRRAHAQGSSRRG